MWMLELSSFSLISRVKPVTSSSLFQEHQMTHHRLKSCLDDLIYSRLNSTQVRNLWTEAHIEREGVGGKLDAKRCKMNIPTMKGRNE